MSADALGDRMKYYENEGLRGVMPHLPIIARMDGRAFHTFTKGLNRPYDIGLSDLMKATTRYLVNKTNAVLGYTQSDEISLLFFRAGIDSEVFFNGRNYKMVSNLASMTSVYFNNNLHTYLPNKYFELYDKDIEEYGSDDKFQSGNFPVFDARIMNVPSEVEAANYFVWRELDATKNSISMAAQSMFSHNELMGKNSSDKQEMMWQKEVNWNDYPDFFKKGTYYQKVSVERPFSADEIDKLPAKHEARTNPGLMVKRSEVRELKMAPLLKVSNRVDVIFGRSQPL